MKQVAFCEQRNAAVVVRVPEGREGEEDGICMSIYRTVGKAEPR